MRIVSMMAIIMAIVFLALAYQSADAMDKCQSERSFSTCAYALR